MELQVEGPNLEIRKSWQHKIEEERDRLSRHHPGLVHNLRVTLESTSNHREGGYALRVIASVPGDTLVVKRKGEKVKALLVAAFDRLGEQLKELQRKRRKTVRVHDDTTAASSGTIKTVSPYESYGFILTGDGREIYFHENALKNAALDKLNEGDKVSFIESEGDKGPCASMVSVMA